MKSLRIIIKNSTSPSAGGLSRPTNPYTLPSRTPKKSFSSKNTTKIHRIETSKPAIMDKYRLVTEAANDRMLQISKSYSKLSKSKRKEKFLEAGTLRSKKREASTSGERKGKQQKEICSFCKRYSNKEKQMPIRVAFFERINKCYNYSQRKMEERINKYQQMVSKTVEDISKHMIDLAKDVEALTQIDYSKLVSSSVKFEIKQLFEQSEMEKSDQYGDFKLLIDELRSELQGKITVFDFQEEEINNQHFQKIVRNIKAHLGKALRENLALKVQVKMEKRGTKDFQQEIQRAIREVLGEKR